MIRILVWMNMPSHHQSAFFNALRAEGVQLIVCYYGWVSIERQNMGWQTGALLSDFERKIVPEEVPELIKEYSNWIHIVPGYGNAILRQIVMHLCLSNVHWLHWSEKARPGLRWLASFPIKRWYASCVNRYAMGALACGAQARVDFMRWGIRLEKIAFLPYSPESPGSASKADELHHCAGQPVFLYVGGLQHRKGIDVLLEAYASVRKLPGGVHSKLILVGNDLSGGKFERLATALDVGRSVNFVGPVQHDQVGTYYAKADVVVLPSRFDGWGAVISEAVSVGKAVIVSEACGASNHLVDSGLNGFVVSARDVGSLSAAMGAYVRNPGLAKQHGEASLNLYDQFTPIANAQRLVKILTSWSPYLSGEPAMP